MDKITKAEFRTRLENNKSYFVTSLINKNFEPQQLQSMLEKADISYVYKNPPRTVVKKQSNAIQFDNESWLYFNQKGTHIYYEYKDLIIMHTVSFDDFDGIVKHSYIVYLIDKE